METRTFKCRFGCGESAPAAHQLKAHYRANHSRAYAKWQAEKAAARTEAGETGAGGIPEPESDAESSLLFAINAEFAEARTAGLDAAACGRVLTYLRDRWAPALAEVA